MRPQIYADHWTHQGDGSSGITVVFKVSVGLPAEDESLSIDEQHHKWVPAMIAALQVVAKDANAQTIRRVYEHDRGVA